MNLKSQYIKLSKEARLYQLDRPIIALTGGISTGKSTVSKYLKDRFNLKIIDADKLVKEIYLEKDVISKIQKIAPESIRNEQIDFKILRQIFFKDKKIQDSIEHLIYSKLPASFNNAASSISQNFLIYEIPLLFEKKLESKFDLTILVYATREIQKMRIKKRDNSSDETIENILKIQLPIDEKRKLADFIIENNNDNSALTKNSWPEVDQLINSLMN